MNQIEPVLNRISTLDTNVQEKFWQGSIPAQFLEDFRSCWRALLLD